MFETVACGRAESWYSYDQMSHGQPVAFTVPSVAASIQATASLHAWTAASLHTTSAGSALVVADALVHALVAGALHQFGHAASTTIGVTLSLPKGW